MAARVIAEMGLQPCPFCGEEAELKADKNDVSDWFWIKCTSCGAGQPSQSNITGVSKAWNRRAA